MNILNLKASVYRHAAMLVQWRDDKERPLPSLAKRTEYLALFCIFLIGAFARLYGLGSQSYWGDEAYTAMVVSFSWKTLVFTPFDVHPPAYYLIAKAMTVFGDSEVSLRLFSVLVGSATILPVWAIARNIMGPVCGLMAAVFIATSAVHIDFSQEARSYTFLVFLLSLTLYASINVLSIASVSSRNRDTDKAKKWLGLYAISTLIALYTHTITLVFLATLNGAMLVGILVQERQWKDKLILNWLLVNVAIGLAYLPRLLVMGKTANDFIWLQHVPLSDAVYTTLTTFGSNLLPAKINLLILPMLVIVLVALLMRRKIAIASVLFALCTFPLFVWAIGFVKPIFLVRTILPSLLGWAVLTGVFVAIIRPTAIRIGLILGLLSVNAATMVHHLQTDQHADLRATAAFLDKQVGENDAVLFCGPWAFFHIAAYTDIDEPLFVWWSNRALLSPANSPQLHNYFSRAAGVRAAMTDEALIESVTAANSADARHPALSDDYDKVWYVRSLCGQANEPLDRLISEANLSTVNVYTFWQTSVTKYVRHDQ